MHRKNKINSECCYVVLKNNIYIFTNVKNVKKNGKYL